MRKLALFAVAFAFVAVTAVQTKAEETWKGTITDSSCGVKHSADKHGDKASDHRACVERCIKNGGEYVLVAGGKPMKIANQKFEGLASHAAQEVTVTGEIKDGAIVVSKIVPVEKK